MSPDGTEGGQAYACRSLIASPLSDQIDWVLVDSTQRSEPPPGLHIRAWDAARRLRKSLWTIVFGDVDGVLVFTSFGPLSLLEKGLVCIVGRWQGKRVVVSFRSFPRVPETFQRFFRWFGRLVCNCCSKIICQSSIAAAELARIFDVDRRKIELVPNWIDTSRFSSNGKAVRSKDEVSETRIVYVGWLHPVKGVEYLIRAAKLLADDGFRFRLTICGNGGLLQALKSLTQELGIDDRVHFEGWVPNERVREELNKSDIFVLPSLSEGMPNALLQAMACGLPVVATNVSSIPEIVQDGENGYLAPPQDADGVYRCLKQLIECPDQARAMGDRNRQQVIENHNISVVWRRVAGILNVSEAVAAK